MRYFCCVRGFRGRSPLGEGVAALRQAQGPWDLWLAEESEGETSPFQKKSCGPIDKLNFRIYIIVHKCIVFGVFIACMPEKLTMKKDVTASAAGGVAPKKPEFSLIDEDLLKSRIYTIRGVKVMLDADLAEIYGYSTKDFNRQVKNNIERFAEDF